MSCSSTSPVLTHRFIQQDMVRADAHLSGVHVFRPKQSPTGRLQVGGLLGAGTKCAHVIIGCQL